MILDLILLAIFLIAIVTFLIVKRKNLKKEGLLFLYKTSWGIKIIKKVGGKHKKLFRILSHISIWLGYALMAGMLYLFGKILWLYLFNADAVRAIKVPPVMPLIPYLPQIFKLDFLPPFYFTYWIIILAVIAITHEFFHGIFAATSNVKTKKTGFGFFPFFLPVFLAAFVELDEKSMEKKSNFSQRAVLSAGTFANMLTALIGVLLLWGFFAAAFTPAGVVFDVYGSTVQNVSSITMINGIALSNPSYAQISLLIKSENNTIYINNQEFTKIRGFSKDKTLIALYYESPALKAGLYGPIVAINNVEVNNLESFKTELSRYSPGDPVTITTIVNKEEKDYNLFLEENPIEEDKTWLGIVFYESNGGVVSSIIAFFSSYKEPHVYYEPKVEWFQFIYDLLWWLILISLSVALVNMLPMGIFDGGRFFYLTILAITKKPKVAEKSFKWITAILLALVILIMIFWVKGMI
jgi:membrane-associated protease RseP (regulator of RpoE activity)